jgi:hypothetical protein
VGPGGFESLDTSARFDLAMASAAGAPHDPAFARDYRRRKGPTWGRYAWRAIALGAVVAVVVAAVVGVYLRPHPTPSKVYADVVLGKPQPANLVCSASGLPILYQIGFPIVGYNATVSTADFGVALVDVRSNEVPTQGSAPPPTPNLPCGAPDPVGWYAEYTGGAYGPWATFPYGGNVWSNQSTAPATLSTLGWFDIISSSDLTGTNYTFTAFGIGGSNVSFSGYTLFPPFQGP